MLMYLSTSSTVTDSRTDASCRLMNPLFPVLLPMVR